MKKLSEHTLAEASNLLEIKNLYINYGSAEAVKGVNLCVKRGSITTLIGANGAGKTSILKAITGLLKAREGTIIFDNEQIDKYKSSEIVKRGIALVPEGRRLFPEMTVLENLELGAYLQKDKKQIADSIEEILSFFPDLKAKLNQEAGRLSGGQQQMVAIGRSLMSQPKLLILDEPSIGLAPIIVQQISEIIKTINKTGVSVLLVEQDAHTALTLSEYGYVLQNGQIDLAGYSQELLENEQVKVAYLGI
jgi:branched-chain amino acid transport system ATP-binding protein